jgi:catecholate siderophore receptor
VTISPARLHVLRFILSLSGSLLLASVYPADARAAEGASGEETATSIVGTVVDATGAVVPGATASIQSGGADRTATSDAAGHFRFDGVPAGAVRLTVTFPGFAPATAAVERTDAAVTVILQPLPLSESVIVQAPRFVVTRSTTGTRTDTLLRDVPQSVSVVTRELVADQRMQSIPDVVRYMPGVGVAQGEGNRDTPIFRGNSSTSDFYVDGIRDDVQYIRDLYNVERIEAFKGPNAMIFGRGGVGGVLNRVTRQADGSQPRELTVSGGFWDSRRVSGDLGQNVHEKVNARLTGMYESSGSYRDHVDLERYGVNPTLALTLNPNTTVRAGYERFHDERTADRGIPSLEGRPVATDASTFFGNPDASSVHATVDALSSLLEHKSGGFTLRNRLGYAAYDKFYQNVFPGVVSAKDMTVAISGYNNATERKNLFNQTDLVFAARTGRISHTLLAGVELGRQVTDNLRQTAYFAASDPAATSVAVPLASPTTSIVPSFRPSATDAENHGVATLAALYAQDQIVVSDHVQAIAGLRYDRFHVDFRNQRTATDFSTTDGLLSPRVGLIYKPLDAVSIYTSYGLSYLPRAGEQLSSLSLTNQALDPEKFTNYEVGAKWDVAPSFALTAAVYRLDRHNVAVADPVNPSVSVLVDGQRTTGFEAGWAGRVTGAWSIAGGYAYQDGEITRSLSATAKEGARLAQLPKHSFSLWNRYDLSSRWGAGLGIVHRGDIFTSTDNTVTLPRYTRADAAVFFTPSHRLRVQANVENLLDSKDYLFANGNNNITPGSPLAVRLAVTSQF